MAEPKIFEEFLDARIAYLHNLLEEPTRIMQSALDQAINGNPTNSELDRLLGVVNVQYDQIQMTLETFTTQIMPGAYTSGSDAARYALKKIGALQHTYVRDMKAVGILTRDMNRDFTRAIENGRESIGTYFKFSKQGRLTESEISEAVRKGIMDKGTGYEAKKRLREAIKERGTQIFDEASLNKYIKKKVLQGYEEKLLNGQVMQIINKNGKVMNFRVNTYSDLVSRTRFGDAQVQGTIDTTLQNGIKLFKVTKHNTKSEICLPHEGQILTADKKDKRYAYIDGHGEHGELNRPLYHPNCMHRIMPYVET